MEASATSLIGLILIAGLMAALVWFLERRSRRAGEAWAAQAGRDAAAKRAAETAASFETAMAALDGWTATDPSADPMFALTPLLRAGSCARGPEQTARLAARIEAMFDDVLSRIDESAAWANRVELMAGTAGRLSHDTSRPDPVRATLEARLEEQTADGAPWDSAAQLTYRCLRANLREDPKASLTLVERWMQAGLADRPLSPYDHAELARLCAEAGDPDRARTQYAEAAELLVPGGRIVDARALLSGTRMDYPLWLRAAGRPQQAQEAAMSLRAHIGSLTWEDDDVDERDYFRISQEFDTFLAELKRRPDLRPPLWPRRDA